MSEKTPCQNHGFEYDEEYMDNLSQSTTAYWGLADEVDYDDNPTTATFTFNLKDVESHRMFHIYAQAQELHSFAFEVAHNMMRTMRWELDNNPDMGADEMLERVGQHIEALLNNHKIDVE